MSLDNEITSAYDESLISEWENYRDQAGLSQNELSKRVGVSATTISRWTQRNYGADATVIEEKVRRFLDLQRERARSSIRPITYVQTDTSKRIYSLLTHAQVNRDICLILAVPGTGKSLTTVEYARRNPNVWRVELAPTSKRIRNMLDDLCEVMGLDIKGDDNRKHKSICRHVANSDGLIIVDEFNHLGADAIEQLRAIHDATGVGVAAVGNKAARKPLRTGERLERFTSRIGRSMNLERVTKRDAELILNDMSIPAESRAKLVTVSQGPGALRTMCKVIQLAQRVAAATQQTLDSKHIDTALLEVNGVE